MKKPEKCTFWWLKVNFALYCHCNCISLHCKTFRLSMEFHSEDGFFKNLQQKLQLELQAFPNK